MLECDMSELKSRLARIQAAPGMNPDVSVVIPVNAQTDLDNVLLVLFDIAQYAGRHTVETVLLINNYPADNPPAALDALGEIGVRLECVPKFAKPGEAVIFTARMHALRCASADIAVLFDADCRIPNINALLDWYVDRIRGGAQVAYTHVGYFDIPQRAAVWTWIVAHHTARWFKRTVLRIPTTRGSNYAVRRSVVLELYDDGYLADDLNVGPSVRAKGGHISYSGSRNLVVYTSGRYLKSDWRWLRNYLWYRLKYNVRLLPIGTDAAKRARRS